MKDLQKPSVEVSSPLLEMAKFALAHLHGRFDK